VSGPVGARTTVRARWGVALLLVLLGLAPATRAANADDAEDARAAWRSALERERAGKVSESDALFATAASLFRKLGDVEAEWKALQRRARSLPPRTRRRDLLPVLDRLTELSVIPRLRPTPASLANLGLLLNEVGRCRDAKSPLESARTLFREAKDSCATGRVELALVQVDSGLADFSGALELMESSEGLVRRACPGLLPEALNTIANAYCAMGQYDRADEVRARQRAEIADHESREWAEALLNDARPRADRGDLERAMQEAEESIRVLEKRHDEEGVGTALLVRAEIHRLAGRLAPALDDCLTAIRRLGDDEWRIAMGHVQAGEIMAAMPGSRPEEAREHLAIGIRAADRSGAESLRIAATRGLARVAKVAGPPREWLERSREAVRLEVSAGSTLSDEFAATRRDDMWSTYVVAAEAARAVGTRDDLFGFLEESRAGALLRALGGTLALDGAGTDAELKSLEDAARREAKDADAAYEDALNVRQWRGDALAPFSAARLRARASLSFAEERRERIARHREALRDPASVTSEQLRSRLAPGDVYVAYSMLLPKAFALVVPKTGEPRTVDLADSDAIRKACTSLVSDARYEKDPLPTRTRAEKLAELVLDPLKLPADTKRLLVSPDDVLALAPFCLLLERRKLDVPVVLVPSASTLAFLQTSEDERKAKEREAEAKRDPKDPPAPKPAFLALGNPVYRRFQDGIARRVYWGSSPLRDLDHSAEEVLAVTREDAGDVRLLAEDATERKLADALASRPRWRGVFLSCHGLVDAQFPSRSALAITPSDPDDGFLTVPEVLRMRFAADLTFLSACETAQGKVLRAEGVFGLTRAFMLAGSPRVISSNWSVSELSTAALVSAFQAHYREGDPAYLALHKAQKQVRAKPEWAHPWYWAAWSLWGLPS
jgi:CHAT domain-containing protein/tetratricopeptide (TPR) repeat protein